MKEKFRTLVESMDDAQMGALAEELAAAGRRPAADHDGRYYSGTFEGPAVRRRGSGGNSKRC
jgi:hypothetical protein